MKIMRKIGFEKEKICMKIRKVFIDFVLITTLVVAFIFEGCATTSVSSQSSNKSTLDTKESNVDKYHITNEIFDTLQRPLGFKLSSSLSPISRKNWEYHMDGIGWWDIYLMTGKKPGNGIYEKPSEQKQDCEIIELQNVKSQYDNTVNMVELMFVSSNKETVENLRKEFSLVARDFLGTSGNIYDDSVSWEGSRYSYTSYNIQQHEDGKWIYIISSFDSLNSLY